MQNIRLFKQIISTAAVSAIAIIAILPVNAQAPASTGSASAGSATATFGPPAAVPSTGPTTGNAPSNSGVTGSPALGTNPTTAGASTSTAPSAVPAPGPGGSLPIAPGTPAVLDLAKTIQLTVSASNALAVANKTVEKDLYAVDAAKSYGRPQVSGIASETYLDKPIKITFGPQTILAQPESTQDVHLQASIPVDLTGQLANGVSIYKLQLLSDQFQRDQVYNSLVLKGETAYFNVLRAQHQVSVAQSALQDAGSQEAIASRQFDAGVGLKIDLERAQTQVAEAQKDLLQAQNILALSQTNLNDATGRPLASPISAVDVPGVTSGIAVAPTPALAGQPPAMSLPTSDMTEVTPFEPPLDELGHIDLDKSIATSLNVRPELEAGLVNIDAAKRQIKLARRSIEPSLSFTLNEHYYPTTSFQTPDSEVSSIVAQITVPLYDGGLAHDMVKEAETSVDSAQSTYQSQRTDVELQVRQAFLNLQTTAQQIAAANSALHQAVAARDLAQVRYSNGVGLYLEITDAESALTTAETSQVNTVYDYLVARAQFENAVGQPNTNPAL